MTKFWGFGCWAYPEASIKQTVWMLLKSSGGRFEYRSDRSHLFGTLHRMTETLAWSDWSWPNRQTFSVTCLRVLRQMQIWLKTLKRQDLENLLKAESLVVNKQPQAFP